ncbi:MAG: methyltransferase domain-containing protein [Clostridiales Family XIII bacterium]|jgi:nucleoside-triphosphatase THEP1|nr:methyltransferase domain-containing protein [Clostridiales Family XIII bacterium]
MGNLKNGGADAGGEASGRKVWENAAHTIENQGEGYDGWLDRHFESLREERAERCPDGEPHPADMAGLNVIELGCGTGDDTAFLAGTGCALTCCDFAKEALRRMKLRHPGVKTAEFNLLDPFPLESASADAVVAGLCLHFFDDDEMRRILPEIRRVLRGDGVLFCRLNSAKDYIPGLREEEERLLSPGIYMTPEGKKRFFDAEAVRRVFRDWDIAYMEERETVKFGKPKTAWELALRPRRFAAHIFLTGRPGAGKSTVILKTVEWLRLRGEIKIGGFKTVFGRENVPGRGAVYMLPWGADAENPPPRAEVAFRDRAEARFESKPEAFDEIGCGLLKAPGPCDLLIMDELGFMEFAAHRFQAEVLSALDGAVPVLGVIKPQDIPFLNKIRAHKNVQVFEVTPENREKVRTEVIRLTLLLTYATYSRDNKAALRPANKIGNGQDGLGR